MVQSHPLTVSLLDLGGEAACGRAAARWQGVADGVLRGGVAGLLFAAFVLTLWMLPRLLDAAVLDVRFGIAKFIALPAAGAALALSWPRTPPLLRLLVHVEAIATLLRFGWGYLEAPTRLCAIAVLPCDDRTLVLPSGRVLGFAPRTCRAAFSALLWLDRPGTVVLGIRGGRDEHLGQISGQNFRIPAGQVTTIRVRVPKGSSRLDVRFDTQELPAGLPDIASAVQDDRGRPQSLL